MARKLPLLEEMREKLICSSFIPTKMKLEFIRDYYHSSLSDTDILKKYHTKIINTLY